MPRNGESARGISAKALGTQPSLYPTRISTAYPSSPIGKDYAFLCEAFDEGTFHCKQDSFAKPVRATEWICQNLVEHLGIAVPEFRIMDHRNGATFFGSKQAISSAQPFQLNAYLNQSQSDETGRKMQWLGRHLSMVYAIDLFLSNPDRNLTNFVLEKNGLTSRLCLIDFADAQLEHISTQLFPIAPSNTVWNGRILREIHGFFPDSALEMIERIRAVPDEFMADVTGVMPDDWMADEQKQKLYDSWASESRALRLSALRTGITNGTLL
jgi:hypothetical protein